VSRPSFAYAAVHENLVNRIENVLWQMVERVHAHGLRVSGSTAMPFPRLWVRWSQRTDRAHRQRL